MTVDPTQRQPITKEEALENARQTLWAGIRLARLMPPRERAIAAHYAGGPSVDEIEQMILARTSTNL